MINYYSKNDNGDIICFTESKEIADESGMTLTTDREIVYGYDGKLYFKGEEPARPVTFADYDCALEAHLKAEQTARGYTTRSPAEYANSSNARWKQDAADWVAHVTAVMEYGLEVENKSKAGETVPTLDEFKAALPKVTWTYADANEEG